MLEKLDSGILRIENSKNRVYKFCMCIDKNGVPVYKFVGLRKNEFKD